MLCPYETVVFSTVYITFHCAPIINDMQVAFYNVIRAGLFKSVALSGHSMCYLAALHIATESMEPIACVEGWQAAHKNPAFSAASLLLNSGINLTLTALTSPQLQNGAWEKRKEDFSSKSIWSCPVLWALFIFFQNGLSFSRAELGINRRLRPSLSCAPLSESARL